MLNLSEFDCSWQCLTHTKQLTHYNSDCSGPSKYKEGRKAALQDGIIFQMLSLNPKYLFGFFYTLVPLKDF